MTNQPPPLFVLASPFSFRSVVSALIGGHPDAYAVPELNLLAAPTVEEYVGRFMGIPMHGLLRTIAQLYAGEQTMESTQLARRWLLSRMSRSTLQIYEEIRSKVAPLVLIDRSTSYTDPQLRGESLRRTEDAFPEARYLHLLRHPRSQGEAWFTSTAAVTMLMAVDSRDYEVDPPVVDPQVDWRRRNTSILRFLSSIPAERHMRIRGEALLADPKDHLRRICRWLGLRWSDNIAARMLRTERSSYSRMGPYGAEWGNNFDFQRSPALRPCPTQGIGLRGALPWRVDGKGLTPEVVELAIRLGYEAPV